MTVLNDASRVYLQNEQATAVYVGGTKVWPPHIWSPADLPGLVGWWDAADTASIISAGGKVSQWNDKSGHGNHAKQAIALNQPKTGNRTINGKNVLDLKSTGNQEWLERVGAPFTGTDMTLLCVIIYDVQEGTAVFVLRVGLPSDTDYADNAGIVLGHDVANQWFGFYQNGRSLAGASPRMELGTAYNEVVTVSAAAQNLYQQGNANGSSALAMTAVNAANFLIGGRYYGAYQGAWNGAIAEIAFCNGVVDWLIARNGTHIVETNGDYHDMGGF